MTDAFDLIAPVVEAAKQNISQEPGDYVEDGRLFCGKCHTAKQTLSFGRLVMCVCSCAAKAAAEAESQQREREKFERIARLRISGLRDEKTAAHVLKRLNFHHRWRLAAVTQNALGSSAKRIWGCCFGEHLEPVKHSRPHALQTA